MWGGGGCVIRFVNFVCLVGLSEVFSIKSAKLKYKQTKFTHEKHLIDLASKAFSGI